MARFDTSGLDATLAEMSRQQALASPTADKMLMAGAEEVRKSWQRAGSEHGHVRTGDMLKSVGYARAPKTTGDVRTIDIYPKGKDRRGVRNAEKAFVLHYGTSKIPGSRWVDDADRYSEETAVPAMIQVWNESK